MSDSNKPFDFSSLSAEERRAATLGAVRQDVRRIEHLITERMTASLSMRVSADGIKALIYRTVDIYALQGTTFPRGYRVLGNNEKTPYYLVDRYGRRPSEGDIVADYLTGWLVEVGDFLTQRLREFRGDPEPVALLEGVSRDANS